MSWLIDGKTNGPDLSWPDGKRIAVMVTFDYDAEFLRISRAESKGTSIGFTDYSRGQYGPHEGLARCLAMLDAVGIKSTFFVPGIVAETIGIQSMRLPDEDMNWPATAICMNRGGEFPAKRRFPSWRKANPS